MQKKKNYIKDEISDETKIFFSIYLKGFAIQTATFPLYGTYNVY